MKQRPVFPLWCRQGSSGLCGSHFGTSPHLHLFWRSHTAWIILPGCILSHLQMREAMVFSNYPGVQNPSLKYSPLSLLSQVQWMNLGPQPKVLPTFSPKPYSINEQHPFQPFHIVTRPQFLLCCPTMGKFLVLSISNVFCLTSYSMKHSFAHVSSVFCKYGLIPMPSFLYRWVTETRNTYKTLPL